MVTAPNRNAGIARLPGSQSVGPPGDFAHRLWCRTRGWGYRLSQTTPWRIPRERLERILAERDAAARA